MAEHNFYLTRRTRAPKSTLGTVAYVTGTHLCYTCEDVVREPTAGHPSTADHGALAEWVAGWKIKGQTAIPTGVYKLAWTRSNRFSRARGKDVWTLEILGVPGYGGIRFHAGNDHVDTDGCPLPGLSTFNNEEVRQSVMAVDKLEDAVRPLLDKGDTVWLHVENNIGEQRSPA